MARMDDEGRTIPAAAKDTSDPAAVRQLPYPKTIIGKLLVVTPIGLDNPQQSEETSEQPPSSDTYQGGQEQGGQAAGSQQQADRYQSEPQPAGFLLIWQGC